MRISDWSSDVCSSDLAAEAEFRAVLVAIDRHGDIVERFAEAPPPLPRWRQDWFPGLDGAAAYALVRQTRPARIVEVGSGHSTRLLARAVIDGGLPTAILCIDPAPRRSEERGAGKACARPGISRRSPEQSKKQK